MDAGANEVRGKTVHWAQTFFKFSLLFSRFFLEHAGHADALAPFRVVELASLLFFFPRWWRSVTPPSPVFLIYKNSFFFFVFFLSVSCVVCVVYLVYPLYNFRPILFATQFCSILSPLSICFISVISPYHPRLFPPSPSFFCTIMWSSSINIYIHIIVSLHTEKLMELCFFLTLYSRKKKPKKKNNCSPKRKRKKSVEKKTGKRM